MVLELRQIQKRFGGVVALRQGNLAILPGEVHLLLGENGAGKSTLMKIAAGIQPPDAGEMWWQGSRVHFHNPAQAQYAGIAMVHQESLLAPHLSVGENIWIGREPRSPFGRVRRRALEARAQQLIDEHAFPLQASWRVDRLSPAGRQMVEILRALAHEARLLIFDEPTSSLSDAETREVFRLVQALKARGSSVIYITHRMEELRHLGDRVTVLRDGETVFTGEMSGISTSEIIRHMVGRELETIYQREAVPPGAELLRVEHLSRAGVLSDISFSIRAGEIVGLAGLIGAGRTELCRALFGIDPVDSGRILLAGREVHIRSPRDAVRAGIGLVPEDRGRTGLATGLSVAHNMLLASLRAYSASGVMLPAREKSAVESFSQRLRIRISSPAQKAGKLSGGNQQKVVISKWVAGGSNVLLFDEPTRGIDVGAKAEVFHLMDHLAREGAAILMVSSELPELLQIADRILVMRQGAIAGELPRHCSQEEVLRLAALNGRAAQTP